MHGKYVLAPVILLMVLVLAGTNIGHATQIQTDGTRSIVPLDAKHDTGSAKSAKIEKKVQTKASTKKITSKKKRGKTKHASTGLKKRSAKSRSKTISRRSVIPQGHATADIGAIMTEELKSYTPYDLWLAYELPEAYTQLTTQARLKRLRLSIVESAYNYVGTPYVWGGTSPDGFDCSGFVRYVYEENGIHLSRTSGEQAREGATVSITELRPGDLIFFNMNRRNRRPIDHVGLYLGEGHFIHAPSKRSRMIKIETLENGYFLPKIVEARRVIDSVR